MPLSASQWVTCLPVTAAALVLLLAYIATTNGNGDGERRARICPLMEAPAAEALIRSRAASRLIAGGTRALTDPLRAADDDGPRHESRRLTCVYRAHTVEKHQRYNMYDTSSTKNSSRFVHVAPAALSHLSACTSEGLVP